MSEILTGIVSFVEKNHEWFFSGLGVAITAGIISFLTKRHSREKSKNASPGSPQINASSIKAGGDVNIHLTSEANKYFERIKVRQEISENRNQDSLHETQKMILEDLHEGPAKLVELAVKLGITKKMLENLLRPLINEGIIKMVGKDIIQLDDDSLS